MKYFQLLFVVGFITISVCAFCQNTTPQQIGINQSRLDRWDLDKYVWSHANYKAFKNSKPVIDFEAIENWSTVGGDGDVSVSSDGKYFSYSVLNSHTNERQFLIQATDGEWKFSIKAFHSGFFSSDGKQYIYQQNEDLCFLEAGTNNIVKVRGIASYRQSDVLMRKCDWVAWQKKNDNSVVLQHLPTGKQKIFEGATVYCFNPAGTLFFLQSKGSHNELLIYSLVTGKEFRYLSEQELWGQQDFSFSSNDKSFTLKSSLGSSTTLRFLSAPGEQMKTLWRSEDSAIILSSHVIDQSGQRVVFNVEKKNSSASSETSIWYFSMGMDKAIEKVNNQTPGIYPALQIVGSSEFSWNGGVYLQFQLKPLEEKKLDSDPLIVKLDVWSHSDTILRSTQPWVSNQGGRTFTAIINPEGGRVIRLENQYDKLWRMNKEFAVVFKRNNHNPFRGAISGPLGDRFWEKDYDVDSTWLISLKDGSRLFLGGELSGKTWFSPKGRYIVYFDKDQQCNYFSKDLITGKLKKISVGIPLGQLGVDNRRDQEYRVPLEKTEPAGIASWFGHDDGLLVYDEYFDIWLLDLTGKNAPINITNGNARQYNTRFRIPVGQYPEFNTLASKDTLLLTSFNTRSMQTGFFRLVLGESRAPELLFMGDCRIDPFLVRKSIKSLVNELLKATNAPVYIVKRQKADEAPNYQLTTDFKFFKPLTDIRPEKKYNWYTAELHTFKQMDGTVSQGILYKPENFDPSVKYPVLIVSYTTLSTELYDYKDPMYIFCPTAPLSNPAWMVSHGYLVFLPDIYFKRGQWGPSAVNTLDGAAKYLRSLSFVSDKLGAAGFSNSGKWGYYVLTHSNEFSAMNLGGSMTGAITNGFRITEDRRKNSLLGLTESDVPGTGLGSLWENKDTWIDHSSVLHADKVTSPLLIFQGEMPLSEPAQIFTALRRLNKKVWWLQYFNDNHGVIGDDAKDFTIRYTQFFDHYLKGSPPPRWMTEGIPYKYKQVESRFELDPKGSCGKDCKVCKEKKYDFK